MCGICGALGESDPALLRRMMEVMRYRGPDGSGTFLDKGVMLGNVRLSIIDIEGGSQPIFNEDNSLAVVYNGEIYNFQEMREALLKKGHKFRTRSDTEVIVHAYEEYGEGCAKLFNGMFAFAIWDSRKKSLFLARDRAGIKPLFYAKIKGGFLFASDVKCLLLHPEVKRGIDLQAMHGFLNLRYVPQERTLFSQIRKLLPGHTATISAKGLKASRYWKLHEAKWGLSEDAAAEALRRIFASSVKRHMISDIPVGVFLSGGFDSSAIVAFASKATGEPLRTYSMGFGEPDDELKDARVVADYFGTSHTELILEKTILKDFPEIIWHMGTPKRNVYPYYIYKAARQHVKVALGGLGGDELFGGYVFRYDYLMELEERRKGEKRLAEKAREAKKAIDAQLSTEGPECDYKIEGLRKEMHSQDDTWSYLTVATADRAYELDYLRRRIYGKKLAGGKLLGVDSLFRPYFKGKGTLLSRCLRADFSQKMTDDFLVVDDGTSMASSLEVRTPFLDNEMIDFAFSLPPEMKIEHGRGKLILRKAMKGILPESVFLKKKQGFATNTFSVYTNEMREMASATLPEGSLVKAGYIRGGYASRILSAKPDQKMLPQYNMIWNLLALELWHRVFIEEESIEKPPKLKL